MSKHTNHKATKDGVKPRAQQSLLDSLGAVSVAIAAMPEDSRPTAKSISEQFMRTDVLLSALYKQILDARANLAALVAKYGMGDAMVDTLTFNLSALEAAYAQRLSLLRKRREEQSRGAKTIDLAEEAKAKAWAQPYQEPRKRNSLWFLAAIMYIDSVNAKTPSAYTPGASAA